MTLTLFLFLLLAYLLGSIPFGLLIAQWVKGIDIRKHGSGNVGATNVFRVVGKVWGVVVLILDAAKGYVAVLLPVRFAAVDSASPYLVLIAVTAILGHSFSVWLRFRGGKGVATSLGVFLALAPVPTLASFGLFWLVFLASRIISLASLSAALFFPFAVLLFSREASGFHVIFPVSVLLAAFVFYTHRANIQRLLKGKEKRLL